MMKFIFLFLGLSLLLLRIWLARRAGNGPGKGSAVTVRVVSVKKSDAGGWWAEVEYPFRGKRRSGYLALGDGSHEVGEKIDCLLLEGGRLKRVGQPVAPSPDGLLVLPAIWFLSASAYLFFIPGIDFWRFLILSALTFFALAILKIGVYGRLNELLMSDVKDARIADVRFIRGQKYCYVYEYSKRSGERVTVSGQPGFIRHISLDFLRYQIGSTKKVRVDKKTGAVYETSGVGLGASVAVFFLCFLSIVLIARV